jgi:hypothetical protein
MKEPDLGIMIAGLTDSTLARLPEPFDLVLEWTKYVPLDAVLWAHGFSLIDCNERNDGTVLLYWSDIPKIGQDYIIPANLYRRTLEYCVADAPRRRFIDWTENRIFLVDGQPVSSLQVFAAVKVVLR